MLAIEKVLTEIGDLLKPIVDENEVVACFGFVVDVHLGPANLNHFATLGSPISVNTILKARAIADTPEFNAVELLRMCAGNYSRLPAKFKCIDTAEILRQEHEMAQQMLNMNNPILAVHDQVSELRQQVDALIKQCPEFADRHWLTINQNMIYETIVGWRVTVKSRSTVTHSREVRFVRLGRTVPQKPQLAMGVVNLDTIIPEPQPWTARPINPWLDELPRMVRQPADDIVRIQRENALERARINAMGPGPVMRQLTANDVFGPNPVRTDMERRAITDDYTRHYEQALRAIEEATRNARLTGGTPNETTPTMIQTPDEPAER